MDLVNQTAVPAQLLVADLPSEGCRGGLVVAKATFELAGSSPRLATSNPLPLFEKPTPLADVGDLPTDLVPREDPAFEVILLGACHAPGGRAREASVALRVGGVRRQLVVSGDRHWVGRGPSAQITRTADRTYGLKGTATLTMGDNSLQASVGASEDGAVEGSLEGTRKTKGDSKDKYGQDASSEGSVGISGKQDKDGKVEVAGQVAQKNSEGDSKQAQVKYTDDDKGKSGFSADASSKDAHGHERKVGVEHSHDAKTGTTTDKVGVSGKNAAGEAQASTSGTTDAAGNTTSKESASATPTGMQTSKVESTSTYPNVPRTSNPTAPGLNTGPRL